MKLIVGLGNPGKEYEKTRHNIGFMVLDAIAKKHQVTFSKNKFQGLFGEFTFKGEKIILLKPQKYMNLSGEVIVEFLHFYKMTNQDLLVFHDDLDLPNGKIRIKQKGSSGGHNGLKDIERNIGTQEYNRVKIGIAHNKNIDTKDYVLGHFVKEELEIIQNSVETCVCIFEDFLTNDVEYLMSKYNCN